MESLREEIAEIGSRTTNPVVAFGALRSSGCIFNSEQQQRLVDTIANHKNKQFALLALKHVSQLTEEQKTQLIRASVLP